MLARHHTPRTTLALALAAFALASCEDRLAPETPDEQFAEEVRELREMEMLPPPRRAEVPEGAPRFFNELDGLDAFLDASAPWDDGPPAWWVEENVSTLEQRLEPILPFFDSVTELLASPDARAALEAGTSLAYRTSIRSERTEYDRYATPSLPRVGRWINLLCSRAVQAGRSQVSSAIATTSLANAFDLLALLDDHSASGTATVVALETNVLRAVHLIAPGPSVDPLLMRSTLDPRLARAGDASRIWGYLRSAVSWRVEITEELSNAKPRHDADHWLRELDCSRARLAERGIDVLYLYRELRSSSMLCDRLRKFGTEHPFQIILDGMTALHDLSSAIYLARYALAANEYYFVRDAWPPYLLGDLSSYFPSGGTPYLECRALLIDDKQAFNEYRVFLKGRARGSDEAKDPLLEWRWDDQVLQQFAERR